MADSATRKPAAKWEGGDFVAHGTLSIDTVLAALLFERYGGKKRLSIERVFGFVQAEFDATIWKKLRDKLQAEIDAEGVASDLAKLDGVSDAAVAKLLGLEESEVTKRRLDSALNACPPLYLPTAAEESAGAD